MPEYDVRVVLVYEAEQTITVEADSQDEAVSVAENEVDPNRNDLMPTCTYIEVMEAVLV